jgi:amino acid permease
MKKIHPSSVIAMIGGIIGAGIFGVPYVFSRSGVLMGAVYIVILGGAALLIHVFYAIIASETPGKHRLVGYARKHLGERAAYLVGFLNLIEFLGALLVYIILGGNFLATIFGGNIGLWTTVFIIGVSVALLLPLRESDDLDNFFTCAIIVVILAIIAIILPKVTATNLMAADLRNWFVPYGVIFFALGGTAVIPEIVDLSRKNETSAIRAAVLGTVISAAVIGVFGAVVVGVSGAGTTENAIAGLAPYFGRPVVLLGSIFGVLAVATQFIVIGANSRDQFVYDFKMPRPLAWALVVGLPLVAYLIGARDFVGIIGFLGATTSAITGLIIVILAKKLLSGKREFPHLRFFAFPLMLLFVAGFIAEIVSFFK